MKAVANRDSERLTSDDVDIKKSNYFDKLHNHFEIIPRI